MDLDLSTSRHGDRAVVTVEKADGQVVPMSVQVPPRIDPYARGSRSLDGATRALRPASMTWGSMWPMTPWP